MTKKRIVVTGARGFIGKNLLLRLGESPDFETRPVTRESSAEDLADALSEAAAVVHLAGVNRPQNPAEFIRGNRDLTNYMIDAIIASGRRVLVIYASSAKAVEATSYGESKKAAESALLAFSEKSQTPVHIFRLPNVFGKWCRPNYNSAVATFCYNIARGLPITINDPDAPLTLVYVDDVIDAFIDLLRSTPDVSSFRQVNPVYNTSVGDVAALICRFREDRGQNLIEAVGTGLARALYATYVSSLPMAEFSYPIASHADLRGTFSEILKTRGSGQFSFFTALPGITRGGHYHHTKTEKFLIVQGEALFRFRHVITGEKYEIKTSAAVPTVVETVPGWVHDVTNVGTDVLISLLWANEVFDRTRPDTIAAEI